MGSYIRGAKNSGTDDPIWWKPQLDRWKASILYKPSICDKRGYPHFPSWGFPHIIPEITNPGWWYTFTAWKWKHDITCRCAVTGRLAETPRERCAKAVRGQHGWRTGETLYKWRVFRRDLRGNILVILYDIIINTLLSYIIRMCIYIYIQLSICYYRNCIYTYIITYM